MPGVPLLTAADLAFLNEQRVARLATADSDGQSHVMPVCFAHVDGRLYVPIDAKPKRGDPRRLRRLRNLRERPDAALLIDYYDEDWTRLRWLLIRARAVILDVGTADVATARERDTALTALERRYPQYAVMQLSRLDLPVITFEPIAVTRWRATQSNRSEA